jgi:hypothetical protein
LKLLLTFETIGAAFSFQKAIKNNLLAAAANSAAHAPLVLPEIKDQVSCEIILTPRCLGVTCSYSALIEYQQHIDIADFLQTNLIAYSKLYQIIINDKGQEIYERYKQ